MRTSHYPPLVEADSVTCITIIHVHFMEICECPYVQSQFLNCVHILCVKYVSSNSPGSASVPAKRIHKSAGM
jgi:hypothetical protein